MKQKNDTKSPVTKNELFEILKDFPTKKDLKKELNQYATKNDLQKAFKESEGRFDKKLTQRLLNSQEAFRKELDHTFLILDERWEKRFSAFTNLILTAIDPLVKDLETRREDREIATAQARDFDKRLKKLEHS